MRGHNAMILNGATMNEALTEYFEKRRAPAAPKQIVTLITTHADGKYNVYVSEVK